jgi:hypothetical protein
MKRTPDLEQLPPLYDAKRATKVNDDRDNSWFQLYMLCLDVKDENRRSLLLALIYRAFVSSAMQTASSLFSDLIEKGTVEKGENVGYAGGTKVFKNGMFFKIPVLREPYTSLEDARKSVGLEFRSCDFVQKELAKFNLVVPLFVVLDYRGFRIGAECHVPVSEITRRRRYNQCNEEVVIESEDTTRLEESLAARLNLASHQFRNSSQNICLPFDVELGAWRDKWIILDLHRLWPPEYSASKSKVMANLLRPEFVQQLELPLDPDECFSWSGGIEKATNWLFNVVIPSFAETLFLDAKSNVSDVLHSAGINIRHMGLVWKWCGVESTRAILEVEMIVRALKKHVDQLSSKPGVDPKVVLSSILSALEDEKQLNMLVWDRFFAVYISEFHPCFVVNRDLVLQKVKERCCVHWGEGIDPVFVLRNKMMFIGSSLPSLNALFRSVWKSSDMVNIHPEFLCMIQKAEEVRQIRSICTYVRQPAHFTHKEVSQKLETLLLEDTPDLISVAENVVQIGNVAIPLAEVSNEYEFAKLRLSERPLCGVRIAIDGCLIGGANGEREYAHSLGGVQAGSLNYLWAKQLEKTLVESGATVFVARGEEGGPLLPLRSLFALPYDQKQLIVLVKSFGTISMGMWERYALDSFSPLQIDKALCDSTVLVEEGFARFRSMNEFHSDVAFGLWTCYLGPGENPLALYVPGCFERSSYSNESGQSELIRLLLSDVPERSYKVCKRLFNALVLPKDLSLSCVNQLVSEVQGVVKRCNGVDMDSETVFFRSLRMLKLVRSSVSIYVQAFRPGQHDAKFCDSLRQSTLETLSTSMCSALKESISDIRPPLPFFCVLGPRFESKLVCLLRRVVPGLGREGLEKELFDLDLSSALKEFQRASGLFDSGILDVETAEFITLRMDSNDYVLGVSYCLGETRFRGVKYGSACDGYVNCVSFIIAVLVQLFPYMEDNPDFRNLVCINDEMVCCDVTAAVNRRDELIAGVCLALPKFGLGERIQIVDIRPGDFIQYWYHSGDGYGGHCGIVEDVMQRNNDEIYIRLYGAHHSCGKVMSLEISLSNKVVVFASRLRGSVVNKSKQKPKARQTVSKRTPAGILESDGPVAKYI